MRPEARFQELVRTFEGEPNVSLPGDQGAQGFGASALRVNGKIFAMLTRDRLVVKLPRQRVSELIAAGQGDSFDAGKGKPMKEWLSVALASSQDWESLAREALRFVGKS